MAHPGMTVSYLRGGRSVYVGVYVCPASSTSHLVFDLELMTLETVTAPSDTVSSFTNEVYRTSPLTSSLFLYPARTSASVLGAAVCVGYGVGLLPPSWFSSREFVLLPLLTSPQPPASPLDAFVDGGVPSKTQRDPTNVGDMPDATVYRSSGISPLAPIRGASSAAFASAPGF